MKRKEKKEEEEVGITPPRKSLQRFFCRSLLRERVFISFLNNRPSNERIFFHKSCSTIAYLPSEGSLTMSFFIREFNYHPSVGKCRTIGCTVVPSGNVLYFNTNENIIFLGFVDLRKFDSIRNFLENRGSSFFLGRIFIFCKSLLQKIIKRNLFIFVEYILNKMVEFRANSTAYDII